MPTLEMTQLDELRNALPESAKDIKLNLQSIFGGEFLSSEQAWGVALTSACFVRHVELARAIEADAHANGVSDAMIDDARAAAALMGMNGIYYRFRHLAGKESYGSKPARLRMQRMARPATSKADFELLSMAGAVLSGCEACINAHEASILRHGLTEDHVHDCARIAAVIHAAAIALDM